MQFRFSAAILDFQLNGTVYKIAYTTIKTFNLENIWVAVGISFLSALELEKPLGGKLNPPIAYSTYVKSKRVLRKQVNDD